MADLEYITESFDVPVEIFKKFGETAQVLKIGEAEAVSLAIQYTCFAHEQEKQGNIVALMNDTKFMGLIYVSSVPKQYMDGNYENVIERNYSLPTNLYDQLSKMAEDLKINEENALILSLNYLSQLGKLRQTSSKMFVAVFDKNKNHLGNIDSEEFEKVYGELEYDSGLELP